MQFNSYVFICIFMPLMMIGYFGGNKLNVVIGKVLLIAGSIVFYAYSDRTVLTVMGISLGINFAFAVCIRKSQRWSKLYLVIPIVINAGLLLYFKYINFAISNFNFWLNRKIALKELVLPVGISFFTFQQIAYIVAIYKKEIEKIDIIDYLAYILYFPKILMGPLVDPVEFVAQLNDSKLKKINWDNVSYGVKIFSFGLFKKVLLADTFAKAVAWGYTNIEIATSMDWILVMLFYTFEIYFDFSGYSDMAVGVSSMLNIELPINFDSPYKAVSIRDFWKRWHISLTNFFTKYIYIPLGGSRKGAFFTFVNTMIVFLVSGVWHGANWTFILWGILHGIFSVLDRALEKFNKKIFEPFRWFVTFGVVNILWLLFRSDSIFQWKKILNTVALMEDTNVSDGLLNVFNIPESTFFCNISSFINTWSHLMRGFWMIVFLAFSMIICFVAENNYRSLKKNSAVTMIFAAIAFTWGFICLSSESVFLYFNF